MTVEEIAQIFEKAAEQIEGLTQENANLKRQLEMSEAVSAGDGTLGKIAEATGLDVTEALDALKSLTPAQKKILTKTAAEEDFSLGSVSDFESKPMSAEEAFVVFCNS
jgi:hypothetical protein